MQRSRLLLPSCVVELQRIERLDENQIFWSKSIYTNVSHDMLIEMEELVLHAYAKQPWEYGNQLPCNNWHDTLQINDVQRRRRLINIDIVKEYRNDIKEIIDYFDSHERIETNHNEFPRKSRDWVHYLSIHQQRINSEKARLIASPVAFLFLAEPLENLTKAILQDLCMMVDLWLLINT